MKSIENTYASGIIKVKDRYGNMVPFYPEMTTMSVYADANTRLNELFAHMRIELNERLESGSIRVEDMPDSGKIHDSDLATTKNETLTVFTMPTETWSLTIDTEATAVGARTTGIPFNLYSAGNGKSLIVDWGDGNTSVLSTKNYTQTDSTASIHEYASPGRYNIRISSDYWNDINILTIYNADSINAPSKNISAPLYWFRRTLVKINNEMPPVKGNDGIGWGDDFPTNYPNDIRGSFAHCDKLISIPENLFNKNINITNFSDCFYYCTSISSIPEKLFEKNIAATTFGGCFDGCSAIQSIPEKLFEKNTAVTHFSFCFYGTSLQSIPSGLFANNTAVTSFAYCFQGCTSLTSIPSGLFDNNTTVTTFQGCFSECTSLTSIPSGLFDKNTAVTDFWRCFYQCSALNGFDIHIISSVVSDAKDFVTLKSGTVRKVYVPANSTTYTKFNSVASSLGLTIIGE